MSQTLELIIKARDEASAKLGTMTSSLNSLKEAMVTGGIAAGVYIKTVKELGDLAKGYMDYAIAAGDFAEKTGMAVEEASALLDAVKDLDVNVGSLMLAFRTMSKQGIDPSIEGLIEVKRQLDGAGSDADRLALALKLMGRSGSDLIPILAQLNAEQLRGLVANLSDAQTVTDAEYQKMLALRNEMAAFNDAVETAKLMSGEWIITNLGVEEALKRLNSVLAGTVSYWQALIDTITGGGAGTPSGRVLPSVGGSVPGNAPSKPPPLHQYIPHALGGPVGGSYIVGEHGAERFTPDQAGTVSPNNDQLTQEIRRMVRTLPTILRDAVQQK